MADKIGEGVKHINMGGNMNKYQGIKNSCITDQNQPGLIDISVRTIVGCPSFAPAHLDSFSCGYASPTGLQIHRKIIGQKAGKVQGVEHGTASLFGKIEPKSQGLFGRFIRRRHDLDDSISRADNTNQILDKSFLDYKQKTLTEVQHAFGNLATGKISKDKLIPQLQKMIAHLKVLSGGWESDAYGAAAQEAMVVKTVNGKQVVESVEAGEVIADSSNLKVHVLKKGIAPEEDIQKLAEAIGEAGVQFKGVIIKQVEQGQFIDNQGGFLVLDPAALRMNTSETLIEAIKQNSEDAFMVEANSFLENAELILKNAEADPKQTAAEIESARKAVKKAEAKVRKAAAKLAAADPQKAGLNMRKAKENQQKKQAAYDKLDVKMHGTRNNLELVQKKQQSLEVQLPIAEAVVLKAKEGLESARETQQEDNASVSVQNAIEELDWLRIAMQELKKEQQKLEAELEKLEKEMQRAKKQQEEVARILQTATEQLEKAQKNYRAGEADPEQKANQAWLDLQAAEAKLVKAKTSLHHAERGRLPLHKVADELQDLGQVFLFKMVKKEIGNPYQDMWLLPEMPKKGMRVALKACTWVARISAVGFLASVFTAMPQFVKKPYNMISGMFYTLFAWFMYKSTRQTINFMHIAGHDRFMLPPHMLETIRNDNAIPEQFKKPLQDTLQSIAQIRYSNRGLFLGYDEVRQDLYVNMFYQQYRVLLNNDTQNMIHQTAVLKTAREMMKREARIKLVAKQLEEINKQHGAILTREMINDLAYGIGIEGRDCPPYRVILDVAQNSGAYIDKVVLFTSIIGKQGGEGAVGEAVRDIFEREKVLDIREDEKEAWQKVTALKNIAGLMKEVNLADALDPEAFTEYIENYAAGHGFSRGRAKELANSVNSHILIYLDHAIIRTAKRAGFTDMQAVWTTKRILREVQKENFISSAATLAQDIFKQKPDKKKLAQYARAVKTFLHSQTSIPGERATFETQARDQKIDAIAREVPLMLKDKSGVIENQARYAAGEEDYEVGKYAELRFMQQTLWPSEWKGATSVLEPRDWNYKEIMHNCYLADFRENKDAYAMGNGQYQHIHDSFCRIRGIAQNQDINTIFEAIEAAIKTALKGVNSDYPEWLANTFENEILDKDPTRDTKTWADPLTESLGRLIALCQADWMESSLGGGLDEKVRRQKAEGRYRGIEAADAEQYAEIVEDTLEDIIKHGTDEGTERDRLAIEIRKQLGNNLNKINKLCDSLRGDMMTYKDELDASTKGMYDVVKEETVGAVSLLDALRKKENSAPLRQFYTQFAETQVAYKKVEEELTEILGEENKSAFMKVTSSLIFDAKGDIRQGDHLTFEEMQDAVAGVLLYKEPLTLKGKNDRAMTKPGMKREHEYSLKSYNDAMSAAGDQKIALEARLAQILTDTKRAQFAEKQRLLDDGKSVEEADAGARALNNDYARLRELIALMIAEVGKAEEIQHDATKFIVGFKWENGDPLVREVMHPYLYDKIVELFSAKFKKDNYENGELRPLAVDQFNYKMSHHEWRQLCNELEKQIPDIFRDSISQNKMVDGQKVEMQLQYSGEMNAAGDTAYLDYLTGLSGTFLEEYNNGQTVNPYLKPADEGPSYLNEYKTDEDNMLYRDNPASRLTGEQVAEAEELAQSATIMYQRMFKWKTWGKGKVQNTNAATRGETIYSTIGLHTREMIDRLLDFTSGEKTYRVHPGLQSALEEDLRDKFKLSLHPDKTQNFELQTEYGLKPDYLINRMMRGLEAGQSLDDVAREMTDMVFDTPALSLQLREVWGGRLLKKAIVHGKSLAYGETATIYDQMQSMFKDYAADLSVALHGGWVAGVTAAWHTLQKAEVKDVKDLDQLLFENPPGFRPAGEDELWKAREDLWQKYHAGGKATIYLEEASKYDGQNIHGYYQYGDNEGGFINIGPAAKGKDLDVDEIVKNKFGVELTWSARNKLRNLAGNTIYGMDKGMFCGDWDVIPAQCFDWHVPEHADDKLHQTAYKFLRKIAQRPLFELIVPDLTAREVAAWMISQREYRDVAHDQGLEVKFAIMLQSIAEEIDIWRAQHPGQDLTVEAISAHLQEIEDAEIIDRKTGKRKRLNELRIINYLDEKRFKKAGFESLGVNVWGNFDTDNIPLRRLGEYVSTFGREINLRNKDGFAFSLLNGYSPIHEDSQEMPAADQKRGVEWQSDIVVRDIGEKIAGYVEGVLTEKGRVAQSDIRKILEYLDELRQLYHDRGEKDNEDWVKGLVKRYFKLNIARPWVGVLQGIGHYEEWATREQMAADGIFKRGMINSYATIAGYDNQHNFRAGMETYRHVSVPVTTNGGDDMFNDYLAPLVDRHYENIAGGHAAGWWRQNNHEFSAAFNSKRRVGNAAPQFATIGAFFNPLNWFERPVETYVRATHYFRESIGSHTYYRTRYYTKVALRSLAASSVIFKWMSLSAAAGVVGGGLALGSTVGAVGLSTGKALFNNTAFSSFIDSRNKYTAALCVATATVGAMAVFSGGTAIVGGIGSLFLLQTLRAKQGELSTRYWSTALFALGLAGPLGALYLTSFSVAGWMFSAAYLSGYLNAHILLYPSNTLRKIPYFDTYYERKVKDAKAKRREQLEAVPVSQKEIDKLTSRVHVDEKALVVSAPDGIYNALLSKDYLKKDDATGSVIINSEKFMPGPGAFHFDLDWAGLGVDIKDKEKIAGYEKSIVSSLQNIQLRVTEPSGIYTWLTRIPGLNRAEGRVFYNNVQQYNETSIVEDFSTTIFYLMRGLNVDAMTFNAPGVNAAPNVRYAVLTQRDRWWGGMSEQISKAWQIILQNPRAMRSLRLMNLYQMSYGTLDLSQARHFMDSSYNMFIASLMASSIFGAFQGTTSLAPNFFPVIPFQFSDEMFGGLHLPGFALFGLLNYATTLLTIRFSMWAKGSTWQDQSKSFAFLKSANWMLRSTMFRSHYNVITGFISTLAPKYAMMVPFDHYSIALTYMQRKIVLASALALTTAGVVGAMMGFSHALILLLAIPWALISFSQLTRGVNANTGSLPGKAFMQDHEIISEKNDKLLRERIKQLPKAQRKKYYRDLKMREAMVRKWKIDRETTQLDYIYRLEKGKWAGSIQEKIIMPLKSEERLTGKFRKLFKGSFKRDDYMADQHFENSESAISRTGTE
ncbi:MAG: hypothetical protein ABIH39_03130 [Candidatus Margulisiibacteriota bacterium]